MFCEEELDGTSDLSFAYIADDARARDGDSLREAVARLATSLRLRDSEPAVARPGASRPEPSLTCEVSTFDHDQSQMVQVVPRAVKTGLATPRPCVLPAGLCRSAAAVRAFNGSDACFMEYHGAKEWEHFQLTGETPARPAGMCVLCMRAFVEASANFENSSLLAPGKSVAPLSEYVSAFGEGEYSREYQVRPGSTPYAHVRWDGTLQLMRIRTGRIAGRPAIVIDQSAMRHGATGPAEGFGKRA